MKIKNHIRAGIVLLALAVSLTACGGSASSTAGSTSSSVPASSVSKSVAESTSAAPESESAASEGSVDAQTYVIDGVTFIVHNVPNDATGNWRFASVSEGVDMTQYAQEYYKQCFSDDSEIHFIIDEDNNTTTKLAYVFGSVDVLVKEHVKDEEFDANTLGRGDTLAEYFVDAETGEVEKIG